MEFEKDKDSNYKNSEVKKMLGARVAVIKNKMIAWGFGIVLGIGISAVGSLSALGILTLPVVLPWILIGIGTTITLVCNKRFLFHLCDNRITEIYSNKRKLIVFFSYVLRILTGGFATLSFIFSLVYLLFCNYKSGKSLTLFHRKNLGLASNHLIFGGIGLAITLAIAVFVFNFSPLAFIAVALPFVLGILFKFVNWLKVGRYRAKNEAYMNDNVASPPRELEEEEIFAVALKRCLCCSSQTEEEDNSDEENREGTYYPDPTREEILKKFGALKE